MRKKIQLQIPTPCHENWDNMLPSEKGKFCQSCSKEVVDFTAMSDSQLVAFFKKPTTGSVCGRFMEDQLGREIQIPKKRLPWVKYFFQITLPAFLISMRTNAQKSELRGEVIAVQTIIIKENSSLKRSGVKAIVFPEIKGRVIDESGMPISYSSVTIKGTQRGTAADSLGHFSMGTETNDVEFTLVVSSVGYEQNETVINIAEFDGSEVLIKLKMKSLTEVAVVATTSIRGALRVIMGGTGMTSCSIHNVKDSISFFWQKPSSSIYPNPASASQTITFVNNKLPEDNYKLEITNVSGQLVHIEKRSIGEKQKVGISLPFITAGTYFIKISGEKKLKSHTEKLIVR